MKQLVPQEAAENRETGERPVRSRHCKQEHTASYMSLSNREGGGGRQTVSQETCQLWYGDDEFQITRFDCTERLSALWSACIRCGSQSFTIQLHIL